MLTEDEHVRVRGADALHQSQDRLHRRRLGDQLRQTFFAQRARLDLEAMAPAQCAPQLHLRPQRAQQPPVVPRLLDVIARAAAHRLDRAVDARPGRHHDDWGRALQSLDAREQVEPFSARRRVAGVIHVHEQRVEVARFYGRQHGAGRGSGLYIEAFAPKEELQRLQDVGLIIGDQEAGARHKGRLCYSMRNATIGSTRVARRAGT